MVRNVFVLFGFFDPAWIGYFFLNSAISFLYVPILNDCMFFYPAPRIEGDCKFIQSTQTTLTFSWRTATSATSYVVVGDSTTVTSVTTNEVTVSGLVRGSYYTFTVTAVGSGGLTSNSITCTNSTSECSTFVCLFVCLKGWVVTDGRTKIPFRNRTFKQ